MLNKVLLTAIATVLTVFTPGAQAGTRHDAPLESAKVENPEWETKCLEAFVNSQFDYAHPLCLTLAQKGMADAQLVTGLMYALGEGTVKNPELAKLWLTEAMRNGSENAKEALIEFNLAD